MSKKSVIINLPGRRTTEMVQTTSADSWVQNPADGMPIEHAERNAGLSFVDLREPRNAMEFAWMLWTFPVRAWFYWASQSLDQPRPR